MKPIDKHDDSFLVCGAASGGQGAIGNKVAHLLINNGFKVRAFVCKHDKRSALLADSGAEIVIGDLLDYESILAATKKMFPVKILPPHSKQIRYSNSGGIGAEYIHIPVMENSCILF